MVISYLFIHSFGWLDNKSILQQAGYYFMCSINEIKLKNGINEMEWNYYLTCITYIDNRNNTFITKNS